MLKITDESIELQSHTRPKLHQILIAYLLFPVLLWILLLQNTQQHIFMAAAWTVLVTITFFVQFNMRVIFDLKERAVFRHMPVIGRWRIAGFDELLKVEPVTVQPFFKTQVYYRLTTKAEPFGKGISITGRLDESGDESREINMYLVPRLNKLLAPAGDAAPATAYHVQAEAATTPNNDYFNGFKHLRETDRGIYTFNNWTLLRILVVIFYVLMVVCGLALISTGVGENILYGVLLGGGMGALLLFEIRTVTFNVNRNVIKRSYFGGLMSKEFHFVEFRGFNLVRNGMYGIYTSTDINMTLSNGGNITLGNVYSTAVIEPLMHEVKAVLRMPAEVVKGENVG